MMAEIPALEYQDTYKYELSEYLLHQVSDL